MVGSRIRSKSLALVTLLTLFLLLVPLASSAFANHGVRTLEVTPETSSASADGAATVTLTGTLSAAADGSGPIRLHFEVESGPADPDSGNTPTTPDKNCTINPPAVSCTVSIGPTSSSGTTLVRGWIDHNQDNATVEADSAEGRDEAATPGAAEPDITDVVEITWTQSIAAACIDAEPETDTNQRAQEHIITAKVTNGTLAADLAGTFECTGTALANVDVTVTITDDSPNAFVSTINGAATGGPVAGGPNTGTGKTDATGTVTFGIKLVDPNDATATTGNPNAIAIEVPGVTGGGVNNPDTVSKAWSAGGTVTTVDATPETETNELNQSHVVTAKVLDEFNAPVPNVNVDFIVTAGPHADNNLPDNKNNPALGYFGDCTTAADGTCSRSYTGTEVGTDTIHVFADLNQDDTDTVAPAEPDDDVSKTWVAAGAGTTKLRIDMEGCNGDTAAPIDEATWELTATANSVPGNHEVCAERFSSTDAPQAGPVTFTIVSGPGFFTTDGTSTNNLGNTITVDDGAGGYNHAFLRSTQTGNTVVRASRGSLTAQGTKPWTVPAASARNIDVAPNSDTNPPGTSHVVTATVEDKFDNKVAGVSVTFTISGAGTFTDGTCCSKTVTTGPDGTAAVSTTSASAGTQTIVGSIEAAATDCELPANSPSTGDPAGNCSETVTKTWAAAPPANKCPGASTVPGNHVVGTAASETLNGTSGNDVICGLGGNDVLNGFGGDDLILGGDGADTIRGGDDNDLIFGQNGNDVINGNDGNDRISGGADNDRIGGGNGNDRAWGVGGVDRLYGQNGNDRLVGNAGDDPIISGGDGNDVLVGSADDDGLVGGPGIDTGYGLSGNDRLYFRDGIKDTRVDGGTGADICSRDAVDPVDECP